MPAFTAPVALMMLKEPTTMKMKKMMLATSIKPARNCLEHFPGIDWIGVDRMVSAWIDQFGRRAIGPSSEGHICWQG